MILVFNFRYLIEQNPFSDLFLFAFNKLNNCMNFYFENKFQNKIHENTPLSKELLFFDTKCFDEGFLFHKT